MATSTYGDLCPGSRWLGMALWNLPAWEVQIPPKTVIGNVQMAKVIPNLKVFKLAGLVLPQKEQMEWSRFSQSDGFESPGRGDLADPYVPAIGTDCSNLGTWCPQNRLIFWGAPNGTLEINKKWERFCGIYRCLCKGWSWFRVHLSCKT